MERKQQQIAQGSPVGQQQLPAARLAAHLPTLQNAKWTLRAPSLLLCCLQAHKRQEQQQLKEFLRARNITLQHTDLGGLNFWQVNTSREGSSGMGSSGEHSAACAPRQADEGEEAAGAGAFDSPQVCCPCLLKSLHSSSQSHGKPRQQHRRGLQAGR